MKRLTLSEKAEIDEFYDGSMASIRHLAKGLGRSITAIYWHVDYKNKKKQMIEANKKWRANNRKKHLKCCNKYYRENRKRLIQQSIAWERKDRKKNPEKYRKKWREYYYKNKAKKIKWYKRLFKKRK